MRVKRGIIVQGCAYAPEADQRAALGQVDEVTAIKPMTSEDRYYQFLDAIEGLGAGDAVHVAELSYLGETLSQMCGALARLNDAQVGVVIGGEDQADTGLLEAAQTLLAAQHAAQVGRVTELVAAAKTRRTATPPKCVFVPEALFDESCQK